MRISEKDWVNYIDKLSRVNQKAADKMRQWVSIHGLGDRKALIDYAYAVSATYGEAAAALACEMYDATALASGASVPVAVPAEVAEYDEVAKTVNGVLKRSQNVDLLSNAVARLVKRTGADTTLHNALRDGAEFAWIPHGDTCSFCIALASRGWQKMSKAALKGGHAEHIHANCDCTYEVRFDESMEVEGYNPDEYLRMYNEAEGVSSKDKINALRRAHYAENRDRINAQKRVAYQKKLNEKELLRITQIRASLISDKIASGEYSIKLTDQQYQKHIEGTKQYEQYKNDRKKKGLDSQGVLTISQSDAQDIIEKMSGTGIIKTRKDGSPMNIEFINTGRVIGKYYNKGEWHYTTKAAIHHGSKGSHIVPIKGNHYD